MKALLISVLGLLILAMPVAAAPGDETPAWVQQAASIKVPALIAVGTKDPIAGSAEDLAAILPQGRALPIPNRDHMLAVGDKVFKAGVLEFLEEQA